MNDTEQHPQSDSRGDTAPPAPTDPTAADVDRGPLIRHALAPSPSRGRIAIIAACASLAGVIVGFVLSTAAYRSAARCQESSLLREVAPIPPGPPPGWQWHQHGDGSDHRCDEVMRPRRWSPPPPGTR